MKRTLRDAFDRWKDALIDQDKQTTRAARHRAHARVTSMQDLIAETPADDIEDVGMRCSILGRDLLVEVKSLMTASQQGM